MRFSELNLEPSLQSAIQKLNYEECTPVQSACIPAVLSGRDVSGLAQTGTGKTAAFLIPLMDRILKGRVSLDTLSEEQRAEVTKRSFPEWRAQNFILVLVPTRELAEQVYDNVGKLGIDSGLRGCAIYGGTSYDKQKDAMKNGVEFVVATPGRLIDLYKEHVVDLKQVRAVVFDEADRMFDMGFKDDMKYILQRIPKERQFLVFSATLNFDVLNTAYQFGADPLEINVSLDQAKAGNVKDELFHVGSNEKPMYLLSLLKKYNPKQAIIFSNFKFSVERIARFLSDNGVPAMGISSLLTQAQRTRVMEQFRAENEKNILVATDVAARGLDIKGVDLVINFDLPNDAESYVHRIGRTGRAGAEGHAYSLVSDKDVEALSRVEDYLKHKVDVGWIEEAELIRDFKPMGRDDFYSERPRFEGSGRGPRREGGGSRGAGPRRDHRGPREPQRDARAAGGNGAEPRRGDNRRRDQRSDQRSEQRPDSAHRNEHRRSGPRGPRPESNAAKPAHAANGQHRSGPRSVPANAHKHSPRKPHAKGPRPASAHSHRKPAPPPSVVQKVSGFFKRLLGG